MALHYWHTFTKCSEISIVSRVVVCLIVTLAQPLHLQAQHNFQSYLNSLTARQDGSVIVINPSTGAIRAAWNLRRATMDAYPPGSTGKIVEAAGALEQGLLTPSDRIVCRRIPPLLGTDYRCVHPPAPQGFTVSSALANSCNYFFTVISLRLNAQSLIHWYSVFGFGTPAELDGMATSPGRVRLAQGPRAKALEAIGEWGVVVTPAQLLEAYVLVANQGAVWPLRTKDVRRRHSHPFRQITAKPLTYQTILNGLVACVRFGTCRAAAVPGVQVAGKTGTASALDGSHTTHAWFVGFAPAERPEVALVVFLDRGTGEHTAAPLAGNLLRHYFATMRKGGESVARH
ncbi:MAG TPA: penicillin-binding transpeptidase domain-containing protein [Terriglobia bacterium]|nr:penicillin-binding transpeptidase domain-containing protein [Terriglobia bacterium]